MKKIIIFVSMIMLIIMSMIVICGAETIKPGETKTIYYKASTGYTLPETITVTGATYTWEQSTGKLVLSNATADVNIVIIGVAESYSITNTLTGTDDAPENVKTISNGGTVTLNYTAQTGYTLPSSVTVTGATKQSWDAESGDLVITNPTGAVSITVTSTKINYTISYAMAHMNPDETNVTTATYDSTIELYITPASGYDVPQTMTAFTVTGATVDDWQPESGSPYGGTLFLTNVTGNITITANATAKDYQITENITNTDDAPENSKTISTGKTVTLNYTAQTGYTLPSTVTVTGATLQSWNAESGDLVITNPTGAVSITVTSTKINYTISYAITHMDPAETNVTTATYDSTVELYITPASGYDVPQSMTAFTVTGATVDDWQPESGSPYGGTLTLTNVTGNITITANATAKDYQIIENLINVEHTEGNEGNIEQGYTVNLSGSYEYNGQPQNKIMVKFNTAPSSNDDYDYFKEDDNGMYGNNKISDKTTVFESKTISEITKIYVWGIGYSAKIIINEEETAVSDVTYENAIVKTINSDCNVVLFVGND